MTQAEEKKEVRTNWSGNYTYSTEHLEKPRTVEELQQVVKKCDKLRALGARHSFNPIADSKFAQVSLENLESMSVDKKARTVTVGAGSAMANSPRTCRRTALLFIISRLCPMSRLSGPARRLRMDRAVRTAIFRRRFPVLRSLQRRAMSSPYPASGTGTDSMARSLPSARSGIVSKITLDVIPTFDVSQIVYENLPFDQLEKHLDEIFASGYSVSLFTDWQNHRATQVWIKRRIENGHNPEMQARVLWSKAGYA